VRNILFSSILAVMAIILPAMGASGQLPDVEAVVKSVPKVAYPKEARETGLEGVVTVGVQVDAAGRVTSVGEAAGPDWVCPSVTRSDVVAMREAAKAAAAKATFTPAQKDGRAIASQAMVSVTFENPARIEAERKAATGKSIEIDTGAMILPGAVVSPGFLNEKATRLGQPIYPTLAKSLKASGTVNVDVEVDQRGNVFTAQPVSGHFLLRNSAAAAACSSGFPPTLMEGIAVKVSGVITYNFVP
jgi:outer membrane biosynthesis protein TonB